MDHNLFFHIVIYASKFKKQNKVSEPICDPVDFITNASANEINQLVEKIDKLPDLQAIDEDVIKFEACTEVDLDKMLALKLMKIEQF